MLQQDDLDVEHYKNLVQLWQVAESKIHLLYGCENAYLHHQTQHKLSNKIDVCDFRHA
jgi:peptide subunit release factor 1 (eRF1)